MVLKTRFSGTHLVSKKSVIALLQTIFSHLNPIIHDSLMPGRHIPKHNLYQIHSLTSTGVTCRKLLRNTDNFQILAVITSYE